MEEMNKLKKKIEEIKNAHIDVYSRIVGYYRPIRNWNKGKKAEYSERETFEKSIPKVNKEISTTEAIFLFWKNSCPSCTVPKAWATANPGLITVINLEENPEFIEKYNLMTTPTLILDLGGKVTRICNTPGILETLDSLKNASNK